MEEIKFQYKPKVTKPIFKGGERLEEIKNQEKPLTDDELLQKLKDTQDKLDELTSKYQKLFLSQTQEIKQEKQVEEIPVNITKEYWNMLGEELQKELLELNELEE